MKYLVTGATGHIGNVLVRKLYKLGHEVHALVMQNDDISIIEPFVTVIYGDITDKNRLFEVVKGYDAVFHLAGMVEIGFGKKKLLYKVNVEGTKNLLEACQTNKIKRLIYTSSVHAIEEKKNNQLIEEPVEFNPKKVKGHYAKTKAIATDIILNQTSTDLETVVVYPSGIIGPYDYKLSNFGQVFTDYLLGRLTAYLKGGYNFVDVRDVADGIISAAIKGKDKEGYILSGHSIKIKELLDWLEANPVTDSLDNAGTKSIRIKDTAETFDIEVIPVGVSLGSGVFAANKLKVIDTIDWIEKNKKAPEFKGIDTNTFIKIFQKYINEDMEIIYLSTGSSTISNYDSACHASTHFPNATINIIDSRHSSGTLAMMVLTAAKMAQNNESANAIAIHIERSAEKYKHYGLTNTVEFLNYAGMCPKILSVGVNLLNAKFAITLKEGSAPSPTTARATPFPTSRATCPWPSPSNGTTRTRSTPSRRSTSRCRKPA